MLKKESALIIVDVQNDFCPGGALAVPHGNDVVPVINRLLIGLNFSVVVTTHDWHPKNHCSFKEDGGIQPEHCVRNTMGAKPHPDLKISWLQEIHIVKGINPNKEVYSGFDGNIKLVDFLKERKIKKVCICGLATDYCVKETAIDAKKAGFDTYVIIDACRGVNKNTCDVARAITEMKRAKIQIITSREVY